MPAPKLPWSTACSLSCSLLYALNLTGIDLMNKLFKYQVSVPKSHPQFLRGRIPRPPRTGKKKQHRMQEMQGHSDRSSSPGRDALPKLGSRQRREGQEM